MRKQTSKILLATVVVSGVLGAGVAVAASQPSWAGAGHPAVATGSAPTTDRLHQRARDGSGAGRAATQTGSGQHVRARDGSGPRHEQQASRAANPDCPYRS